MVEKVWLFLALFAALDCCLAKSCVTSKGDGEHKYYTHSGYEGQIDERSTSHRQKQRPGLRNWGRERNDTDGSVYWMLHDIEEKIKEKCKKCKGSTSLEVISFRKHRDYKGDSYLVKVRLHFASNRYRVLHLMLREEDDGARLLSFVDAAEHEPIEPWEDDEDGGEDDSILDIIDMLR